MWTILFTPGFCARNAFNETFIHSAFLLECQFRKAEELCENKANSCHANTLQYCDWSWCNPHQGPHIPEQLPANKSNNYRLCAAINLHNSAGIFRLNPNPFARVNIDDCSSNLPPQCLNWQSKQLIKTLPSPPPHPTTLPHKEISRKINRKM